MKFNKKSLLEEIQKYIYAHNFNDLKVFSKQYFHSIMMPSFSDNTILNPYSIISIDFNNMNKINENGVKNGDKILHNSIKVVLNALPKNVSCARIGGDEFVFLLNGISKEDALLYEKEIHNQMSIFSKLLKNTTITSHCLSSDEANSLSNLLDIADSAINMKKQTSSINGSFDNKDILQSKINKNFTTFFNNLRFHNFPLEPSHMKTILFRVLSSYNSFTNGTLENSKNIENDDKDNKNFSDITKFQKLHSFFTEHANKKISTEELDDFDNLDLFNILNTLIRDPLTMQFNKSYFMNQLLYNKNQKFKALRLSSTFVKASNTLNDTHSSTDKQISDLEDKIYNYLNTFVDFNQDSFSDIPKSYMISLGGGDMLLALGEKTNLKVSDIKDFLTIQTPSTFSNDNLIRPVCADSFRNINKHNFNKVLEKQKLECNQNKIPLINEILADEILTNLLSSTLNDTFNFYKAITPNMNDVSSIKEFMHMVSSSILDIYSTLNVVHDAPKRKFKIPNFLNKIFRVNTLALPEALDSVSANHSTTLSSEENSSKINFVPKCDIDYSKVKNNMENQNNMNISKNNDKDRLE